MWKTAVLTWKNQRIFSWSKRNNPALQIVKDIVQHESN